MADDKSKDERSLFERALRAFADVRAGEGVTVALLTFGLFLLLSSYYVIKPIRDSLITGVPKGAEYKSYMGAAIAVALLFAVPAYARFASSVPRNKLLLWVTAFFVSNLVGFYLLSILPFSSSGTGQLVFALGFFLWVGVFNMMVIAQYWAFANDVYTEDQGKRLFPMVGIGASVGSAVGSLLLEAGIKVLRKQAESGGRSGAAAIAPLLLPAAVVLGASAAIALVVHARETKKQEAKAKESKPAPPVAESRDGAFKLVLSNRYLLLIALFSLVFTLVNTNSEFVKDVLVKQDAQRRGAPNEERIAAAACPKSGEQPCSVTIESEHQDDTHSTFEVTRTVADKPAETFTVTYVSVDAGAPLLDPGALKTLQDDKVAVVQDGHFLLMVAGADKDASKAIFGSLIKNIDEMRTISINQFYLFVNVLGALLQSFVVSRIVALLGLRRAFFLLPAIALLDATTIALVPVWGVVRFPKIIENATDYSLNNTLRNMLWLPTTKRMKYLAKQAVDTFFVRSGDVASALFVFVLADQLKLGVGVFAITNAVFIVVWLVLARLIVVENAKVSAAAPSPTPTP